MGTRNHRQRAKQAITRRLERRGYRHGPCDPFPSINDTGITRVAAFFFVGPVFPSAASSMSEASQQRARGWEEREVRADPDAVPGLFQGRLRSKNEMKVVPLPRR